MATIGIAVSSIESLVVAGEDALLVAEHLPSQCGGLAPFPDFGRKLDPVLGRQEHGKRIEHHATASRS